MIGLGSNRLSVCRRGGMSVTQAGRGGMEWLAGGRVPDLVTPYSAQATAALVAQFPTQWPTIRDYGFAHPEIVGYMNAYAPEDAKIAMSLVPGIGYRYLESRKTGSFDLGFKMTTNTNFELQIMPLSLTNVACVMAEQDKWAYTCPLCDILTNGLVEWNFTSQSQMRTTGKANIDEWSSILLTNGSLTLNGERVSLNPLTTYNATKNMILFDQKTTSASAYRMDGRITYLKVSGDYGKWFVPIKRNGVGELLDLVSGTTATKYGSFTISETPAS